MWTSQIWIRMAQYAYKFHLTCKIVGFCLPGLYKKQQIPQTLKRELKDHTEKGNELFDTFAGTSWVLFGGK